MREARPRRLVARSQREAGHRSASRRAAGRAARPNRVKTTAQQRRGHDAPRRARRRSRTQGRTARSMSRRDGPAADQPHRAAAGSWSWRPRRRRRPRARCRPARPPRRRRHGVRRRAAGRRRGGRRPRRADVPSGRRARRARWVSATSATPIATSSARRSARASGVASKAAAHRGVRRGRHRRRPARSCARTAGGVSARATTTELGGGARCRRRRGGPAAGRAGCRTGRGRAPPSTAPTTRTPGLCAVDAGHGRVQRHVGGGERLHRLAGRRMRVARRTRAAGGRRPGERDRVGEQVLGAGDHPAYVEGGGAVDGQRQQGARRRGTGAGARSPSRRRSTAHAGRQGEAAVADVVSRDDAGGPAAWRRSRDTSTRSDVPRISTGSGCAARPLHPRGGARRRWCRP